MEDRRSQVNLTYYEYKLIDAADLYNEAVKDEGEHQVIVDGSKLKECRAICITLMEQRARIPLDIQAQANYYMSIGHSDDIALDYLRMAVSCCELHESQIGESVQGREIFEDALQKMLITRGAEQSEYGGAAVTSPQPAQRGRSGGLLQARGLPTMTITAPTPAIGSRRKLPTVKAKRTKREESFSDDEDHF